jgi:hypothetical protein
MISKEKLSAVRLIRPQRDLDSTRDPDPDLVAELADLHPKVRLAFHQDTQRWVLWEQIGGTFFPITAIADAAGRYQHPTYGNTIHWLSKVSRPAVQNKWAIEEWLNGLDAQQHSEAAALKKQHEPQIREGSKDLYNLIIGKKMWARRN